MEVNRLKNTATKLLFPFLAVGTTDLFTGTAWGALTNAALIARYTDANGALTTQGIAAVPIEDVATGEWYLAMTAPEINHDIMSVKIVADEIETQTILINTLSLTNIATVDAVVDAIKLITDALPDAGALTTIINKTDNLPATPSSFDASTEEVDIGAVTGTPVTDVDDFKADVATIATRIEFLYNTGKGNVVAVDNGDGTVTLTFKRPVAPFDPVFVCTVTPLVGTRVVP